MHRLPYSPARSRRTSSIEGRSIALRRTPLAVAVSALFATGVMPTVAFAQDSGPVVEEIIVTAARRAQSVQDIPLNIAAFDGELLEKRQVNDLAELGRNVPGMYVVDQGKRAPNRIVVRGLNLDSITSPEGLDNNGGNVVSTYVGDIPLYVDLSLADMDRVEVLLGPQGTLYGSGTLGGAIRFIPKRPDFAGASLDLRASGFDLAESDDFGFDGGLTANFPLSDNVAMRFNFDQHNDPGFIDTPFLVREAGVSDPEPDFSDPAAVAANLFSVKDTNTEESSAGRIGLRWQPSATVDANFTYHFQDVEVGARNTTNVASFGTGNYESGARFREPNDRETRLASSEITADLGFAELTSATGYSTYHEEGQRDQTDLLITLEFGYEGFPSFSAFTAELEDVRTISQELRLVSKGDSKLTWIGGLFYSDQHLDEVTREFAPHFDEYLGGDLRPDSLEYINAEIDDLTEKGVFGEIGYQITDKWQVTIGGRYYDYNLDILTGSATPLFETSEGNLPADEDGVTLDGVSQGDSGSLFKFNTSYRFTGDVMGYVTVSEGYRIGGSNGVGACPDPLPANQIICGLPDEVQFFPDKTTNYEVGMRSQWLDRRLTVNTAVYFIDWKNPQLSSATVNGANPITKNGLGAESKGIELSLAAQLTDRLDIGFTFSHTQAELSDFAPDLLRVTIPPGFGPTDPPDYADGLAGDRLPGSPKSQGTFSVGYQMPLANGRGLDLTYGFAAIGDVVTKIGNRAGGETLGGYTVHYGSAVLRSGQWTVGVYGQNLLNKYARTGVRSSRPYLQTVENDDGDVVHVRSYGVDVLRPREIGIRFTYALDL